ncbi:MAG: hypothetical protein KIS77_03645 [Saprospiraceae bacterium]|nr:hypothetical protein [Saprospiraceae bacterium]
MEALVFRIWPIFSEPLSAQSLKSRAKVRTFGRKQSVMPTFSASKLNFAKKMYSALKVSKLCRLFDAISIVWRGNSANVQCRWQAYFANEFLF